MSDDSIEEEIDLDQEEHEAGIHSARWPDLEEEPEIDSDLDEEIDKMVWDVVKDMENDNE
jgi:hypothetical protein